MNLISIQDRRKCDLEIKEIIGKAIGIEYPNAQIIFIVEIAYLLPTIEGYYNGLDEHKIVIIDKNRKHEITYKQFKQIKIY